MEDIPLRGVLDIKSMMGPFVGMKDSRLLTPLGFLSTFNIDSRTVSAVELNATPEEITKINKTLRDVNLVMTNVKTISGTLLEMYQIPSTRTSAAMEYCKNQCARLTTECNKYIVSLDEAAKILDNAAKTTSFRDWAESGTRLLRRQGESMTYLCGALAAVATQAVGVGVPLPVAAGVALVCVCVAANLAEDPYNKWREEEAELKESNRIALQTCARDLVEVSNDLRTVSPLVNAAVTNLNGDQTENIWKRIEEIASSLNNVSSDAQTKLRAIPYFKSRNICTIS